jgi:uncharacterized protein CbrC (UPF0167 family)
VCRQHVEDRLELGIGDDLIYNCVAGGHAFAVPADEERDALACPQCASPADPPPHDPEPAVCVPCLHAGRAALTKDTEYGMVRWEDAVRGRTHGVPVVPRADRGLPLTEPDEEGWVSVLVPSSVLLELIRTPTYPTWQGARWLFCCSSAMTYIGEWTRVDLERRAMERPEDAFAEIFDTDPDLLSHLRADPAHHGLHGYVFRCRSCGRLRGHLDAS